MTFAWYGHLRFRSLPLVIVILASWGINAGLVSDPVFSLDLPRSNPEPVVGIQLRAFKTINDAFLQRLAEVVVREFHDKKIELYVFQNALDMRISQAFEKMLKQLYPEIQTEIIHSISKNEIAPKPCLSFPYTHKKSVDNLFFLSLRSSTTWQSDK